MAIVGNKDYYQYGTGWFYGIPNPADHNTVEAIGFKRPDCKQRH
jgi:hypothetical protein